MGREKKGEKRNTRKGRYNRNGGRTVDDLRFGSCNTAGLKSCGEEEYNKMITPYFIENFWVRSTLLFTVFTPVFFLDCVPSLTCPFH